MIDHNGQADSITPDEITGSKRIVWEPSGNTNAVFNTVYSV